jgi:outer membrane receptor protein involved in Fe transport
LLTVEHSYSEAPGFAALGQNLTLDPDPFTKVGLDFVDTAVIEQTSVLGQFTHGFAFGDLTVLGNFKSRDGDRENGDLDHFFGFNTPLLTLVDEQFEDFTRHGAEVRLASPGGAAVEWLIGADYQTYESDVVSDRTGSVAGPFAFSAPLRSQIRRDQWTEELFSYSFFGLVGFDLTGRLNLTLEARVQHDDKDFLFERVDGDPFTNDAIPATLFSQSETKFLPTASLRYQIADGHNLYARFATGYRPGGFNYQPQVLFFDRTAYGPETAYSGEVGWKGEMQAGEMKLRADLAGFYTYTKDIQTTTQLAALVTVASLQNVGDAEIYGAEASLLATAPLFGGEFYANLGASTANGSFQDGASVIFGVTTYDLSGARTPRTRDYIVNVNVAYSHPVGSDFDAYVSASLQAEGGGFDNALGDLGVADSRFSESFETLDLKAGFGTDNWRLSVYGKNVTDEVYRLVEVTNNSYHNDRRVYGAELAVNF